MSRVPATCTRANLRRDKPRVVSKGYFARSKGGVREIKGGVSLITRWRRQLSWQRRRSKVIDISSVRRFLYMYIHYTVDYLYFVLRFPFIDVSIFKKVWTQEAITRKYSSSRTNRWRLRIEPILRVETVIQSREKPFLHEHNACFTSLHFFATNWQFIYQHCDRSNVGSQLADE